MFFVSGLLLILKPSFLNINTEIPWWVGVFVFVMGLVSVILPTRDLIVFDKNENTLTISQKSLIKKEVFLYKLDSIKLIELWVLPSLGKGSGPQYKVACVQQDDHQIILNPNSSSSATVSLGAMSWNLSPEKKIGKRIATFLNVPYSDERRPPTVTETLSVLSKGFQD